MNIWYNTALGVIFGVKKYATELLKVVEKKSIEVNYKRNLVEVDATSKTAIFDVLEENKQEAYKVTSNMECLEVDISPSSGGPEGWSGQSSCSLALSQLPLR